MNLQGLIGKKTYQSQGFLQDGTRVPLSAVLVVDNLISQVKTADKDGYNSVQIGFGIKKKTNKALTGHSKKAGLDKTPRFLKEIRVDDLTGLELGARIDTNAVFKPGDIVDVSGVSKGKGFAGVVKRWGFHGGPRTHGQSDRERAPGSIGQTTTPGRVYKGKKMAGKMGNTTATVRNLEVIEITADGVILIKGLIPGSQNSLVVIKKVGENKKFVPLYKEVVEEPVIEEVQEDEKSAGSPPASDDAQKTQMEDSSAEPSSLSGSQLPESEGKARSEEKLTSSSSENGQSTAATEKPGESPAVSEEKLVEEKKEEVAENAK